MQANYGDPGRGKQFLMRIILASLAGLTPEEFAEEEMAIMDARRQGRDPPDAAGQDYECPKEAA